MHDIVTMEVTDSLTQLSSNPAHLVGTGPYLLPKSE
jgi:hypothetical protein